MTVKIWVWADGDWWVEMASELDGKLTKLDGKMEIIVGNS
jgi:hypothetical protein